MTTTDTKPAPTGIAAAMKFFGKKQMPDGKTQTLGQFKEEWDTLSPEAKEQLLSGLKDGTLTYAS